MTNKYTQTSKRWGYYPIGRRNIGMTPNIAGNKKARVSYILGYLAGRKAENSEDPIIEKYEKRREKHNLSLLPFNAGYRNARKGKDDYGFGYESRADSGDPEDFYELDKAMGENPSVFPGDICPTLE